MKGDFSRLRFDASRHYTSVLQQQGRVALDADTNEQCAINEYLRGTEAVDIIGSFGGPVGNEGFAISISGNTIQIGAGHYYVRGLLCENAAPLGYANQPYLIHPSVSDTQLLAELQNGSASAVQVWLEVWQRLVTALEDACLREPALGQADTTARVQTVWRVIAEPVAAAQARASGAGATALRARVEGELSRLQMAGTALAPAAEDCCAQMYQPQVGLPAGKMMAQTTGGSSDCSCQPTPAAGYRGLENQLYRVEIHHGGDEKTATFKWSRENGSVVAAVTNIFGSQVFVDRMGPDANLGFAAAEWVEIIDDTDQFGPTPNQSGGLFQVKSTTPEHLSLTMTTPVVGVDSTKNPRLRRWDQSGLSAGPNGIPLSAQTWVNLESGIQIQFSPGQYQPGDYWLLPARTASGQIDWPPCDSDGSPSQPPHRIHVHRAPLACLHLDPGTRQLRVDDCRRQFPALTDLTSSAAAPALHVVKLNWANDDIMTFDQLLAKGLQITLDQAPTGRLDSGNVQVSWEVPVLSNTEPLAVIAGAAPIVLRTAMPLDGQVTASGTTILWTIPFRTGHADNIHLIAVAEMNALLMQGSSYASFTRMRIRLMGEMIYGGAADSPRFLDGRSSGRPGVRSDGVTPRNDLVLPSGANQGASDFESWLYLAPTVTIVSLTVQPNAISFATGQPPPPPQATVTINYAPLTDTQISLSVTTPPGVSSVVSVPAKVTIPKGKASATFPVSAGNTGSATPATFVIVASLQTAIGIPTTQTANLTVTGAVIIK
jgi:uncharacterized protein DUF6519